MGLIDVSNIYPTITGGRDLIELPVERTMSEVVGASIGRFRGYMPMNPFDPLLKADPDFDVAQEIFDLDQSYHRYSSNLILAQNKDHLDFLIQKIDETKKDHEILGQATIGQLAFASIFDPINLISLPVAVGKGAINAAVQVGKYNMVLSAAEEAALAASDPVQRDAKSSAVNIGLSGVAGFALGGIVGFATTRGSSKVTNQFIKETKELEAELAPKIDEEAGILVDESFDPTKKLSDFGETADFVAPEVKGDPTIAGNWFTNSYAFKFATSGFKRNMQAKDVPVPVKNFHYDIEGDAGHVLLAHQQGETVGISVHQEQAKYQAEMHQFYTDLQKVFIQQDKTGTITFLDYSVNKQRNMMEFLSSVNRLRVSGAKPINQAQEEIFNKINDFSQRWEKRLRETNLIGSVQFYRDNLEFWNERVSYNQKIIDEWTGRKDHWYRNIVVERLKKYKGEVAHVQDMLQDLDGRTVLPSEETVFHPRFFLTEVIKKRRDEFEKILFKWFTDNPSIKVFDPRNPLQVQKLSPDPDKVKQRVKQTVDKIISEGADNDFENAFFGYGKSKHFMHRRLDIPNHLVMDFIEMNPFTAFMAYNQKVAPRYSFAKKFGGEDIETLLDRQMDDMWKAGMKEERVYETLSNIRTAYDRVMNAPLRNPARWDAKLARRIKDVATFNYMGSVGLTSLTEFGRLMSEHGVKRVMRTMIARYNDDKVKLSAKEVPKVGEGLEGAVFSSAIRYSDEMLTNPQVHDLWEKGKEAFYILNGLTPVTRFLKTLDGILRQDQLIEFAMKEVSGEADEWMSVYLRRYGFTKADAKKLAANKGTAWETSDSGLIYANTDNWTDEALKEKFQRAMSSGILNTIMNATPADRPRMADGVALIPMRIARKFGMKEDPKYRGYARTESAMLSLPFQFYSFALAAVNKTTAAYTTGQMRSPLFGAIWMMGLGYGVLEVKSQLSSGSRRVWENTPFTDKLIRSFDQSGLAALYTDMFYTSISSSMAMTGRNYLDGYVRPKFPEEQGIWNSMNQFAGAGPSVMQDYYNAAAGLVEGQEGSIEDAINMIPGMRLFFIRYLVNTAKHAFEFPESKDGFSGYGRY